MAGFWVLGTGAALGAGFTSAFTPQLGVDGLSGLFLGALGLVAAPALIFSLRYLRPSARGRAIAGLTAAFLLAMATVICARDPLTFLLGWELMTLLPAAVILLAREADEHARQTVFSYVAITHLGGVGTWISILLLAQAGAIGNASAITSGSGLQTAIALAALIGMGTKAGVMPMHVWLPRAHPIAPAPVSALMSGVMIKVAMYALVRVLVEWLGGLPIWLGVLVLALGALSAVGGVVYALFEHDLKRLLALHSIENIGIIVLGIGACLLLRSRGADQWAAFALGAALLHTVNHAVFKALLFLGAGAFERAVGSLEIDRLGGLLRRMPWTGAAFLVGAMAIAGLPPLNGFASEWLTLQALLHVSAYGCRGRRGRRDRARRAGVDCGPGAVLLRQGVGPRPARRAAPQGRGRRRGGATADGGCRRLSRARVRRARPRARTAVRPARRSRAVAGDRADRYRPALPGTGSLPTGGIALVLVGAHRRARAAARPAQRRARPELGLRAARRAALELDERRIHQAAPPRARGRCSARSARSSSAARAASAGGRVHAAACRT